MKNIALITGATSGLGLSYAKYFASKGYNLIITGRRESVIRSNAKELMKKYKIEVQVIITELSNDKGVNYLLDNIKGKDISVLVNNAGFGLKTTFADTSEDNIKKLLYLQTVCVTRLTHFVLKNMLEKNNGIIINISSDGAFAVIPHNVLYSSTKLYILNLTEGLHMELDGTNVKVQAVCPGFIDSHFHESAGMHVNKNKKGLFGFRKPDDIVSDAMHDLECGKVVSIPDKGARLLRKMVMFMPRKVFYKKAINLSKKMILKK
ncbi:SDR family NAD(P)-dependent oxidoreductase [Clostridium sp. BJN0001]|uniref:SDR family NAD(P)-dependent oxidoreductase n=1 Tax=Clostridium sp. BJN0001 TaxID=2930219 RepID=UPI001FD27B43|nr:SDR family NAD(P)-dependent oxidoreductase [Clostridium sp. BJN0001]